FNSTADRAVFDFETNINPFLTIYDAGGHDTLDLSGWTRNSVLDLREGEFSSGFGQEVDGAELNAMFGVDFPQWYWEAIFNGQTANAGILSDSVGIAYGTVIDDGVPGSVHDRRIGNDADNRLDGGVGPHTFTEGGGADPFVVSSARFHGTISD